MKSPRNSKKKDKRKREKKREKKRDKKERGRKDKKDKKRKEKKRVKKDKRKEKSMVKKWLKNVNKPNLVLDLDNTLISSVPLTKLKKIPKARRNILDIFRYDDAVDHYRIFHRPYLQEFLDYICLHFHVFVWTAASDEYAKFVVDKILKVKHSYDSVYNLKQSPKRLIEKVLTHKDCITSQSYCRTKTMKDIQFLPTISEQFTMCNTIIMDDMPDVKRVNKKNAIRAEYFDVEKDGSEYDSFLIRVMGKLKVMNERYRKIKCVYEGENRK